MSGLRPNKSYHWTEWWNIYMQNKNKQRKLQFDKHNPEINIFSFLGKNTRKQRVIFVQRKNENASYGIIFSFVHIQANLNECQKLKVKSFFSFLSRKYWAYVYHFLICICVLWYILPYVTTKKVVFKLERAGDKKFPHNFAHFLGSRKNKSLNSK